VACKTPPQGWEKTVPRHSPGCSWCNGVETRGFENETCLGAGRPPRPEVARLATVQAPGNQPALRTAWFGGCIHAGLDLADSNDLVPSPDLDGEGAGAVVQDGVGAVAGPCRGGIMPPRCTR
jgi:hypothetical protein